MQQQIFFALHAAQSALRAVHDDPSTFKTAFTCGLAYSQVSEALDSPHPDEWTKVHWGDYYSIERIPADMAILLFDEDENHWVGFWDADGKSFTQVDGESIEKEVTHWQFLTKPRRNVEGKTV